MANGNNIVKSLGGIDDPNALANALIALDPRLAPKTTQPAPAPIPTMEEQQAFQQAEAQRQQQAAAYSAPGGMGEQLQSILNQTQSGALAPDQLQGALQQAGVSETPSERQSVANAMAIQQGTPIPNAASPTGQFGGAPSTVGQPNTVTTANAPVDMDALNQAIDAALGKPSDSIAAPAAKPLASSTTTTSGGGGGSSGGSSGGGGGRATQPAQVPKVKPFAFQSFTTPEALGGTLNPMTTDQQREFATMLANLEVDPQRQELERQLEQARLGTRQDIESLWGPSFDRATRNLEEQMQAARERQVGVTNAQGKLFSPLGRGEIALAEKPYAQAIGDVNLQQAQAAQQLVERLELQQNQLAQQIQQLEARRGQLTAAETLQLQQMERQFAQNEVQRQFANHMAEQGFGLQTQAFNVGQDFDLARFLEGARQFGMDFGLRETAQNTLLPLQAEAAQIANKQAGMDFDMAKQFRDQVGFAPELVGFRTAQQAEEAARLVNVASQQGIDFNEATRGIREEMAQAQLNQALASLLGTQNQNSMFPMKAREQALLLQKLEQALANAPSDADLQRRLTEAQITNYNSQANSRAVEPTKYDEATSAAFDQFKTALNNATDKEAAKRAMQIQLASARAAGLPEPNIARLNTQMQQVIDTVFRTTNTPETPGAQASVQRESQKKLGQIDPIITAIDSYLANPTSAGFDAVLNSYPWWERSLLAGEIFLRGQEPGGTAAVLRERLAKLLTEKSGLGSN